MTKPKPGTAVAVPQEDRLSPERRAEVQRMRSDRNFVMALTAEAWGATLDPQQRYALAEFVRRYHLDVNEVDILGGRPYRNGYYYRRRIAEMRTAGKVEWSQGEHIGPNKDLERLAKLQESDPEYDAELTAWAKDERRRRMQERIRWEVPEDATYAYVARVKIVGDQNPLEGCDWITPLRTKKVKKWGKGRGEFLGYEEKIADPIGAEEPEKTVVTRAWRRAGLLVAAEIPELAAEEAKFDAAAEELTAEFEHIANNDRAREIANTREPASLPAPKLDDPYAVDAARTARRPKQGEEAPVEAPRPRAARAPVRFAEVQERATGLLDMIGTLPPEGRASFASAIADAADIDELENIIVSLERLRDNEDAENPL